MECFREKLPLGALQRRDGARVFFNKLLDFVELKKNSTFVHLFAFVIQMHVGLQTRAP